ncbi:unnamed protein product [Lathyrus sativus]|nr:unnamed protein product [Lathyrus sativus]
MEVFAWTSTRILLVEFHCSSLLISLATINVTFGRDSRWRFLHGRRHGFYWSTWQNRDNLDYCLRTLKPNVVLPN